MPRFLPTKVRRVALSETGMPMWFLRSMGVEARKEATRAEKARSRRIGFHGLGLCLSACLDFL